MLLSESLIADSYAFWPFASAAASMPYAMRSRITISLDVAWAGWHTHERALFSV